MPWLETEVRDQRIQFIIQATRPGANMTALCEAFGISRTSGYKWLGRYRTAGSVAALADQSRRPHQSPQRTDARRTAQVVALRRRYGWGGAKLAPLLRYDGVALAPRTIDRIIAREGLTHRRTAPTPARQRFERAAPNELWQMDAKGHYPLAPGGRCHPFSVLDDHSRFAVGLYALPALQTAPVHAALVGCFERYGVPDALLMDHGTPWWCHTNPGGLTRLAVVLLDQGIRLTHGAVRHPQTQGKVERFHRTLGESLRWRGVPTTLPEFATVFAEFRATYNHVRPHASLGQQPPATRYRPSRRAYRPVPPPWEYPAGTDVRRVTPAGLLRYAGRAFFVSHALAEHDVGCEPCDDRVLVIYRHMYVRELQLRTGRSVSLLQPLRTGRVSTMS